MIVIIIMAQICAKYDNLILDHDRLLYFESKQIHLGWNSSWIINGRIFLYTHSICTLPVERCSGRVLVSKGVSQLWSSHSSPSCCWSTSDPEALTKPTHTHRPLLPYLCAVRFPLNFTSWWIFPKLSSEYVSDILYQVERFFLCLRIVKCHSRCWWGKIQWVPCICKPKNGINDMKCACSVFNPRL